MAKYLKYRGEQIRELLNIGVKSVSDIAEKLGLSPGTIKTYSWRLGIRLPKYDRENPAYAPIKYREEQIRRLIQEGAKDVTELAEKSGLSTSTIRNYSYILGINLPRVPKQKKFNYDEQKIYREISHNSDNLNLNIEEIAQNTGISREYVFDVLASSKRMHFPKVTKLILIKDMLSRGEKSLENLCKVARLRPNQFWKRCRQSNIQVPDDLQPYGYMPEIDYWVDEGKKTNEIAEILGVSRQSVHQYLLDTLQIRHVRQHKLEQKQQILIREKEKEEKIHQFISVSKSRAYQLAKEKGWPYEKALEYKLAIAERPDNIEFKNLVKIFSRYEKAKKSGNLLTLEELGNGVTPSLMTVSRILEITGLEPMNGAREKASPLTKQQKRLLKKARNSGLSISDVAYFLKLNYPRAQQFYLYNDIDFANKNANLKIISLGRGKGTVRLTYKLAHQIYEAESLGFKHTEISELLDRYSPVVQYALEHRDRIESKLEKMLNKIFA